MRLSEHSLNRIRNQISEGRLILFTGAGFSRSAFSRSGARIPSIAELKHSLFELCYPTSDYDEEATLGELYQIALSRQRSGLEKLLQTALSVDSEQLPEYYQRYYDFPWRRCYTLNVDDLDIAVASRFDLRRPLRVTSATSGRTEIVGSNRSHPQPLDIIHLNGIISDNPDQLTFSEAQYAKRIANREIEYLKLVADITSHPGIFIGTELREIPLWQHLELRRRAEGAGRDLRPSSILVTQKLSQSRQELLGELRLEWYQGTAESFAEEVLAELDHSAAEGFAFIERSLKLSGTVRVPLVSELVAEQPKTDTEYLMGEEPQWTDLLEGRAIQRSTFPDLAAAAGQILGGDLPNTALAITGTAGTGKSTSLMRLALKYSADGLPVLWIDKYSQAGAAKIRARIREFSSKKLILAIDDADLFGNALVTMAQDLIPTMPGFLLVFAVRANKLDRIADALRLSGKIDLVEHVVPFLDDSDIDALISTLDANNRLGVLKGAPKSERRDAFAKKAGRQLLVAMIEATSGEKFEEKVFSELEGLSGTHRLVYGIVSVASAHRHYVTKDQVVLAVGGGSDQGLVALDDLTRRHLLFHAAKMRIRARHRVIADLVLRKLQESGELKEVIEGLAFSAAAKVHDANRANRHWRLLAQILNHAFLNRVVGILDARAIYANLENVLSFDYHYWLQRGSLEVEVGDVKLGANFLRQARSMKPDDYRIETEYAYMLIRRAYESPGSPNSPEDFRDASEILEEVIRQRGRVDYYPYHVLGSQGLSWSRRGRLGMHDKRELLAHLEGIVGVGCERHPRQQELRKLLRDLRKELLMTVVDQND